MKIKNLVGLLVLFFSVSVFSQEKADVKNEQVIKEADN